MKTLQISALLALAVFSTGCLWKTQRVEPPAVAARTATLDELLVQLKQFETLTSMRATVDLGLSYRNDDMDELTDLKDVRGFILAERPGKSRIQAQYPVTHQKAFDMVSDENEFSVYLVWRDRFIQGPTALESHSEKRVENIRPQHIVEPILIAPPAADEIPALDNQIKNGTLFHVVVFRKLVDGQHVISRKLWFNRSALELRFLEIYDGDGNIVTTASYTSWLTENGAPYPSAVRISRPVDGYQVVVTIKEPGINATLPADAFVLEPPPGVKVERIDEKSPANERARVQ